MAKTLAEEIEELEASISNTLKAQSVSSEGRTLARARLDAQYELLDRLKGLLNRQSSRGRGGLIGQRRET